MLSRISLLTQKGSSTKYQRLLKLTTSNNTSHHNRVQLIIHRGFSASTETKAPEEVTSKAATESSASNQDDYNLDEVSSADATSQSQQQATPKQRGGGQQQQQYQKREGGFVPRQRREEPPLPLDKKALTFEEYKQSKSYQLQQEIFNLIRTKIGSSNKEKVQRFYTKLQEELRNRNQVDAMQKIDDIMVRKIQALILEQKQLDDKVLFEELQKTGTLSRETPFETAHLFPKYEHEYFPLREEMGDTQKTAPISKQVYEELFNERQERIIMDSAIDQGLRNVAATEAAQDEDDNVTEQDLREENEEYNELIQDIRNEFFKVIPSAEEKNVFAFDRISGDVPSLLEKLENEQLERQRKQGIVYEDNDVDQLSPEFIDRHLASFRPDKEAEEEFEEVWQGTTSDIFSNLRDDMKSQYDQARVIMKLNQQLRQKILFQVRQSKNLLSQTQKQKERLVHRLESFTRDFQSDVIPKRVFDFIGHDKQLQNKTQSNRQNKRKLARQYLERKFDHNTVNVDVFNNELQILISHYKVIGEDKKLQREFKDQMTYLIELMEKNQVYKNFQIKARLFEYGVITRNNDYANQQLKQIVGEERQSQYSVIDTQLLNQFYNQSLSSNNFNGLGHLQTYLEKYGVDISGWNLNQFKGTLEFNLNEKFNLNNVLIFTKYYTHYHQCKFRNEINTIDKSISDLNEGERFALNKKVFNNQGLVDMRSLFGYLVQSLGTKQAIDPVSKEDALWRIVEFFTKGGISEIANFGETSYNTISENDLAQYLKNRVSDSKAFEKITQTLIRQKDSQHLHNSVIQNLKEYSANNFNTLPVSFESSKIRNAYLRLKAANETKKTTFSEKNIEYFLYLFKQNQMWAEIIDACESFSTLTGSSLNNNEIVNYYLSDTLLQLPSDKHFFELIQEAVYQGKQQNDAGYVTAMTKAHLKDGAVDHALKFFETEVAKLRDVKSKREEMLVAMFDSAYTEVNSADANITYTEFKNRYLDLINLSTDLVRESFAVTTLQRIIQNKQYDEIETLFQLSLVAKQENAILSALPGYAISGIQQESIDEVGQQFLSDSQANDLAQLKERRAALESKLNEKDVKQMTELMHVMKEKKINILEGLNETSADDIQKMFKLQSKDQVETVLKRTQRFQGAIKQLRDENSDTMQSLWQKSEQAMSRALKRNIKDINVHRDVPDRNIDSAIENTYKRKKVDPLEEFENNEDELSMFNDYMLHDAIYDENDPLIIKSEAHDQTLADMKDELLTALNNRKGKVLTSALKIFNKVQDQTLKSVKLSTVEQLPTDQIVDGSKVNESLQKFNILLNDPRSPIYSAIQTLAQYKGDKGIVNFNKIYRDLYDFLGNRIDVAYMQRERDQLEALSNELQKSQLQIKALNSYILNEQQAINKEIVLENPEFSQWRQGKDRQLASTLEKRIQSMYEEFKSKGKLAEDLSREEKLSLMKDVFSLEFGSGEFSSSQNVFPSFYCQDLIVFGIENNSVEAVRLGEKMMSENGYTISIEMQQALKDFLINNSDKYQKAIKKTGPIDNTSLYRRMTSKNDESVPIMMNMDDPYWQEFLERNCARTQQWRIPSHLAWNHKQHGIVGEVVDFQRVRDTQNQFKKYF